MAYLLNNWLMVHALLVSFCIINLSAQQTNGCTKVNSRRELRQLYENSVEGVKVNRNSRNLKHFSKNAVEEQGFTSSNNDNNNNNNSIDIDSSNNNNNNNIDRNPMYSSNNIHDTHRIEELLLPDFSWKPRRKVSIYNIIITRLWNKILRLGNDPRVIVKLKQYIMKKLNITNVSHEEFFGTEHTENAKRGETFNLIGCAKKGYNKDTKTRQLCTQCIVVTTYTNMFPRKVVEYTCSNTIKSLNTNKNATCLDGYGVCKQNVQEINVLKKTKNCFVDGLGRLDVWKEQSKTLRIKSSCTCQLPPKDVEKYFSKTTEPPKG